MTQRLTYCEIYNEVHGNAKTLEDLCLTPAHAAAWAIVKMLDDRYAFDRWEHTDDAFKDEIFLLIVQCIENNCIGAKKK